MRLPFPPFGAGLALAFALDATSSVGCTTKTLPATGVLPATKTARVDVSSVPIGKFAEVSPGIYRGARPDDAGVRALVPFGVKTILNIDNDEGAIAREKALAESLGLKFVSKPLSGFFAPSDADIDFILDTLADPAARPIFVHCEHGEDRTGLAVGLYRVEREGVAVDVAYTEMLDRGFHELLFLLKLYWDDRTAS